MVSETLAYILQPETADRALEDMDRYFRDNHNIIVCRDKDAISSKRPAAYKELEQNEMRRHSSVTAGEVSSAAEKRRKGQLQGMIGHEKVGVTESGDEKAEMKEVVEV